MEQIQMVSGFRYEPYLDRVFVCDYGQPDQSKGGIILGDSDKEFGRYRMSEFRFGEVLAIGPGMFNSAGERLPMPEVELGDPVIFSRKHGTRLPGDIRYDHPEYGSLLVRVLDTEKVAMRIPGFVPWWNVQDSQIDPSVTMSG